MGGQHLGGYLISLEPWLGGDLLALLNLNPARVFCKEVKTPFTLSSLRASSAQTV